MTGLDVQPSGLINTSRHTAKRTYTTVHVFDLLDRVHRTQLSKPLSCVDHKNKLSLVPAEVCDVLVGMMVLIEIKNAFRVSMATEAQLLVTLHA